MIGADSKGHATLSCSTCTLDIGSLDIKFHGGASWLYNLFSSYIADALKSSIQGQVSFCVCVVTTESWMCEESWLVINCYDLTSYIHLLFLFSDQPIREGRPAISANWAGDA